MGSMVRPAPLSFSKEANMPDEIYLQEILQRDRDDYDPYEYIEEENLLELGSDQEIEEFDWDEEE